MIAHPHHPAGDGDLAAGVVIGRAGSGTARGPVPAFPSAAPRPDTARCLAATRSASLAAPDLLLLGELAVRQHWPKQLLLLLANSRGELPAVGGHDRVPLGRLHAVDASPRARRGQEAFGSTGGQQHLGQRGAAGVADQPG